MLNYHAVKTLEEQLAQAYCRTHSFHTRDPDEVKETVFVGTPEQLTGEVLAQLGEQRDGIVPDYPQGLVLYSNGRGAFD